MSPRILMLSLSRDLAERPDPSLNEAQLRQRLYGRFCETVEIIVKAPDQTPPAGLALAENIRVHATGTGGNLRTAWRMWRDGNARMRQTPFNLVVAQEPFLTGVVACLLAARWKLPLCLHYVCDFLDNEEWLRERPLHRLLNVVGKFVARRAAVVRVDSADECRRLAAIGVRPDAVRHVPFLQPGLEAFAEARADTELRRKLLSGGDAMVLTVARLDPQKDLDTLLSVAERVSRQHAGVRFVVVGDGPERGRFEAAIRARRLGLHVQLIGWVDFARLPAYFASADLFLLTSRYETSARVLVLARAAGLPIVTTAVSGAAELAAPSSGSVVAPIGDVTGLAACVEERLVRRRETRLKAAATHEVVLADYGEAAVLQGMEQLCAAALTPSAPAVLPKLVYVLPKYDPATEEHFLHTYGLLEALAERTNLAVIIERAAGRAAFGSARVFRHHWPSVAPLRLLEMVWLCARLRGQGHRTFYVHYSYFGAMAACLVTRLSGGRVFYWHCVSRFFKKSGWTVEALSHRIKAELPLDLTMRIVDHVVTGTPSLAAFYQRTFGMAPSRLRVVPNEIRPERFTGAAHERPRRRAALGIQPEEFVILFVHRLAPRKGAHHLAAIAQGVLDELPRARFVIAGDGPSRVDVERALEADARLASRVQLLGWVPNADVAGWYAASDAFVMPSEEEGFPRVLLECMAAGLPFVAADVGGVRDICDARQQWSIVTPGDIDGFVSRLVTLAAEPERARALTEAGHARVRAYTTDVVAERTLEQLELEPGAPVAHPPVAAAGSPVDSR
jgi:glycosyltransferase involved in cell wall biosynthesis